MKILWGFFLVLINLVGTKRLKFKSEKNLGIGRFNECVIPATGKLIKKKIFPNEPEIYIFKFIFSFLLFFGIRVCKSSA